MEQYSADAMRVALADAGDALDDANFEDTSANSAILRLTKELAWAAEVLATRDTLRAGPQNFHDNVFENEINHAVSFSGKVSLPQSYGPCAHFCSPMPLIQLASLAHQGCL